MGNDYKISCGKVAGRSHVPANIPCQDSVITKIENGVTMAVLSDGCGSATLSHEGSKITVESVAKLLAEKFDELYELNETRIALNLLKVIVGSQVQYIRENRDHIIESIIEFKTRAQKNGDSEKKFDEDKLRQSNENELLSYFYGTLCFIAIKDNKALIGQIGDGRVGLVVDNNLYIALQEKKEGEVNGTTYPANALFRYIRKNDEKECEELRVIKFKDTNIQAGFVVSDGCDALIEYVDREQGYFFRMRFNAFARNTLYGVLASESQEEADQFIAGRLEKIRATTTDDCSIGVIVRDLPDNPDDVQREIYTKPHPTDIESPENEEKEDEEEEEYEPEQNASDLYGDLFKEYVDSGALSPDVYDVLDRLGYHANDDKSVTIEQLVNAYLLIVKEVLEKGEYYLKTAQDNMSEAVFCIIKECDTLFSWPNNGVCPKVTKKKK